MNDFFFSKMLILFIDLKLASFYTSHWMKKFIYKLIYSFFVQGTYFGTFTICYIILIDSLVLTLPMLRLLSSKAQERKRFRKAS